MESSLDEVSAEEEYDHFLSGWKAPGDTRYWRNCSEKRESGADEDVIRKKPRLDRKSGISQKSLRHLVCVCVCCNAASFKSIVWLNKVKKEKKNFPLYVLPLFVKSVKSFTLKQKLKPPPGIAFGEFTFLSNHVINFVILRCILSLS